MIFFYGIIYIKLIIIFLWKFYELFVVNIDFIFLKFIIYFILNVIFRFY